MKKFAAAVLVSAMATLGVVPATSALENYSENDYICVVHGKTRSTSPEGGNVTRLEEAYISVDIKYAEALIQKGRGVCPVFSSVWESYEGYEGFDYEYFGRCDDKPLVVEGDIEGDMDDSNRELTNASICTHVGTIDSRAVGEICITSSHLVKDCGRLDVVLP